MNYERYMDEHGADHDSFDTDWARPETLCKHCGETIDSGWSFFERYGVAVHERCFFDYIKDNIPILEVAEALDFTKEDVDYD